MKPGERIRLIKESANILADRPWAEAQLTLDQFGFKIYEPDWGWNNEFDPLTYFIGQIKDGYDPSIAALHEDLIGDDAAPLYRASDTPWGDTEPLKLFVSHIHPHRVFVGQLKKVLAGCGIDAFVAHNDIAPSQQWREVIKAALATCDALVAVLHPGFHKSQWCDQEAGWALGLPER